MRASEWLRRIQQTHIEFVVRRGLQLQFVPQHENSSDSCSSAPMDLNSPVHPVIKNNNNNSPVHPSGVTEEEEMSDDYFDDIIIQHSHIEIVEQFLNAANLSPSVGTCNMYHNRMMHMGEEMEQELCQWCSRRAAFKDQLWILDEMGIWCLWINVLTLSASRWPNSVEGSTFVTL